MDWYIKVLKDYAVFTGRATRQEYWMFFLFNFVIVIVLSFLETAIGSPGIFSAIYSLAVLIPGIAVTIRRLHDTGKSGWWILISFIPVIGAIVLLVFMVLDSDKDTNEYGENPKLLQT